MNTFDSIDENYRFLVLEVGNQASAMGRFLENPSPALFDKIVTRDDYIDNLKNVIENKCFSKIHEATQITRRTIDRLRAIQIIAVNLERIADFCVNIVKQLQYLNDPAFIDRFEYKPMLEEIFRSIEMVQGAREKEDLSAALAICRSENILDTLYKDNFDRIMSMLRTGLQVENLITVLFIFRYLERIGDSLLNIGEALIFCIIGEKIKIEQFQALQQTLHKTGFSGSISELDFQSIWGTRSGCRISRVGSKQLPGDPARGSIFKEGALVKMRKERENIESWESIFPSLGPKVFSYHEEGDKASMLVQFLPGCTLEELALTTDYQELQAVYSLFEQTLVDIWDETALPGPAPTDYMTQLSRRMDSVLQIHRQFLRPTFQLNETRVPSTRQLLKACADAEQQLPAPRTVFIHGDFNANNIVYDHAAERIHFIDFHRSCRADAVQDISVFLVSHYRLPVFDRQLRERLNTVMLSFYRFASEYAHERGDRTFQARLTLALARSFFTSTRFELNRDFSRDMFLRSQYLLEKVAAYTGAWEEFALPECVFTG